jgi:hypothetical protein
LGYILGDFYTNSSGHPEYKLPHFLPSAAIFNSISNHFGFDRTDAKIDFDRQNEYFISSPCQPEKGGRFLAQEDFGNISKKTATKKIFMARKSIFGRVQTFGRIH